MGRRPAYLAAAVALVATLTGLPAAPSAASSTASTGLSTASSTGRTATPSAGASSASASSGTGAGTGAAAAVTKTSVVLDSYVPIASPGVPLSLSGHVDLAPSDSGQDLVVEVAVMNGGVSGVGGRAKLEEVRDKPTSVTYRAPLSEVPLTPDHTFTLDAQLDQKVSKTQLTIYPMRVSVMRSGTLIAAAYTFLVWAPPQPSVKPTAISTVLPISAPPRLRSDGMLTDNGLAEDIKPAGRLARLLEALAPTSGQRSTVALALDPTLLKTLQVMAGRDTYDDIAAVCTTVRAPCYRYASPGGVREQPPSADAATFLDHLGAFARTPGNTVFALPWGDVDLAALVHAGKLYDANWAVNTGRTVVADVLGPDVSANVKVAYPVDGLADDATLAFLADQTVGMSTVILDDRLIPATSKNVTPTALTSQKTSAGPIHALAADSKLTELVTTPAAESNEPKALGDVLAELAMITLERASQSRLTVLALPRDWNPSAEVARQVLQALGAQANPGYQPFYQPTVLPTDPVGTAEAAGRVGGSTGGTAPSATTTTAGTTRREPTYPQWAADREIPTSYVEAVEHLRDEAALLDPVLCTRVVSEANPVVTTNPPNCKLRETVVKPMKDTLLTALSVSWRADRPGAVRLSQEVDGRTNLIRSGIQVVASAKVTLTSREGTVPLTVNNLSDTHEGNAYPMTVMVSLSANDKTRLRSASRIPVTVQPGGVKQVLISVSSDAAGSFPVFVQVLTPDGQQRLTTQPARILVRSTAYGTIATAITYAAVGLFAAAVLLRLVRRRRRRSGVGRHDGGGSNGPPSGGPPIDEPPAVADVTGTGPHPTWATEATDQATTPVRRIQANAAGTQRTESQRAYAGGVPANPSEP
ncbi:DUF6049 family protein [Pseudofrankia saprophytica]|uniref:DUF6049 family protein n=1 Tax=Pseudofrankia saprophytica TaxID=298655 RepID=UPI000309E118|nr:DUF6049 family protein [Pseudofrankia saprophytica]